MSLSRKQHLSPHDLQYTINWWRMGGNFNLEHYERVLTNRMAPKEIIGWAATVKTDVGTSKQLIMVYGYSLGQNAGMPFDVLKDPKEIAILMEPNRKGYIVVKAKPIYK